VAVNLGAGLALRRKGVVLLDLDPIGAATFHLVAEAPRRVLADYLEGDAALGDVLAPTAVPGLRIVAASRSLLAWDRRPEKLSAALDRLYREVPAGVDYVLLDLPPTAGAIVRGALAVLPRGGVLAPVQARALDLVGFSDLVQLIEELREQNRALELVGIVPMRLNRTALSGEVVEALVNTHGKKVLPGIRDAAAVARAPLEHKPVQLTAPRSPAAEDFAALTRAVLHQEDSTA
jgi:chromosome partitioning protein